jgi:hypothetical protein
MTILSIDKENYCSEECRCLVYNNFEKQERCRHYNRSIMKAEQTQCTHNFQTMCGSMSAQYDDDRSTNHSHSSSLLALLTI